jgi:plastocyanin
VNAFHVLGGLLAVWALAVSALGVRRENFPASRRSALAVGTISVVLTLAAISSAVITGALEADEEKASEASAESAPEGPSQGGQQLRLAADAGGDLRFDKQRLTGRTGEVQLVLRNPASIEHNVAIEGQGVKRQGPTVGKGGTSTVRADLRAGRYTFYCSVPGHRQGGMEGEVLIR